MSYALLHHCVKLNPEIHRHPFTTIPHRDHNEVQLNSRSSNPELCKHFVSRPPALRSARRASTSNLRSVRHKTKQFTIVVGASGDVPLAASLC